MEVKRQQSKKMTRCVRLTNKHGRFAVGLLVSQKFAEVYVSISDVKTLLGYKLSPTIFMMHAY